MAAGFAALALWIRDMNKLPCTALRSGLAWHAAVFQALTAAAWICNAGAGAQTDFGRWVQTWQWTGRAAGGLVLALSVAFSYRRSAADRRTKAGLLEQTGG